ncbi:unnamed protein product [Orchesella dallaii]|uniref:Galactokinase n=1 Tax=Orchesella dallaii TaxID=48710 RepID=A0ABP1QL30_9HEXA
MEKIEGLEQVLQRAKEAFKAEFGEEPTIAAQAPGRVNIIGEHTDYNEGFVFPMAIPLGTVIVGKPTTTGKIRLLTSSDVDISKSLEFDAPTETARLSPGTPKWANYMKGVIEHFPATVGGFDASIVTTVPLGGGLSSSASLEVATCTFLESLTGKVLSKVDKALLCQKAEHTFANMPCGIMDQFVSCMGVENGALLIDCRSLQPKIVMLDKVRAADNEEIVFIVVNSNVKHQLTGSEYPQRRGDCYEAAEKLGLKSLREATIANLRDNREKLGERVYQRALHVVSENERCIKAEECIANGDIEGLGRVMYQSHVSLRDLYQVSCPELDQLVDITMQVPGVYGSRMTGGGFGGCIVAAVKSSQAQAAIEEVHKKYTQKATAYIFTAKQGAGILKI